MELKHILESLLFVRGEPFSVAEFAKITNEPRAVISAALEELSREYAGRGVVMLQNGDEFQFGTNPENREWVERFVKSEFTEDLTRASVETLATVAYKGPITRAEIDYIRGVNSSFMVRNLLMRGLVSRRENPKDARSYLYEISFDFLKYFGLTHVEELPQYAELKQKEITLPELQNDSSESA